MKIIAVLLLVVILSGCTFAGLDTETVMRPPKATGEQAAIQSALDSAAGGKSVTFKYPQSGEYRSAIIMHDLDGDDEKEAIAFFRPQGDDTGIHMCIMQKKDDAWIVLSNIAGPGSGVDRIIFGNFNDDHYLEIVVGWTLSTIRDKSCSIYQMNNGIITELLANEFYTEMTVMDMNRDGHDDLLSVFSSDQTSIAKLLSMQGSTLNKIGEVRLDAAILSYTSIQTTPLDSQTPAMVLDGYVSTGVLATELLYWDDEKGLLAPMNDPYTGAVLYPREVSFLPTDVDGDGFIEFPSQGEVASFYVPTQLLDEDTRVPLVIAWSSFNKLDGKFTPVYYTVVGPSESVWIDRDALYTVLEELGGEKTVTLLQNDRTRTTTCYLMEAKDSATVEPLFEIQVFAQYVWENNKEETKDFIQLEAEADLSGTQAGVVYAIRFSDREELTYRIQSQIIALIEIQP